jgi:hypothetical protein
MEEKARFYEIKSTDGSRIYINLSMITAVIVPTRFGTVQNASITMQGNVNINLSILDAEDLVKFLPK